MNLIELKNLLNEKIEVVYGYCKNPLDEMQLYWTVNKKPFFSDFLEQVQRTKDYVIEGLSKIESHEIAQRILHEYDALLPAFKSFIFNGNEYLVFNNLKITESFTFADGGYNLYWERPDEAKIIEAFEIKNKNPHFPEWQKLKMAELTGINNPEAIEDIDRISRHIYESLLQIVNFIKVHFEKQDSPEGKKMPDRLNVKQQILILDYLFTHFRNSKVEIPNNRLAQLLGSVLGRNSETIRSLLTYMPRVEDNESDDKIAKTPKNLYAVIELFDALKLQSLQSIAEQDIEKLKKIKK